MAYPTVLCRPRTGVYSMVLVCVCAGVTRALMESQYPGGPIDKAEKNIIFGDDFRAGCWNAARDNGNTSGSCSKGPLWHSSQMQGSYSGKVVDKVLETGAPARSQGKCMRFEWLRSRCTGSNTSKKAHLGSPCPPGPRHDRWYGFSLYLPANCGWENDGQNTVIMQFHNIPDHGIGEKGIQPSMTFNVRNGDLSYGYTHDKNANSSGNRVISRNRKGPFVLATLPIDRWLDFVMHLNFDPWGTGAIEIWMNGKKTADHHNIGLGLNNRIGANFSIGVYQHTGKSDKEKKIVYMDEVRIGNTHADYEAVAPRGAAHPATSIGSPTIRTSCRTHVETLPGIVSRTALRHSLSVPGKMSDVRGARVAAPPADGLSRGIYLLRIMRTSLPQYYHEGEHP